jgi:hypothetical protein
MPVMLSGLHGDGGALSVAMIAYGLAWSCCSTLWSTCWTARPDALVACRRRARIGAAALSLAGDAGLHAAIALGIVPFHPHRHDGGARSRRSMRGRYMAGPWWGGYAIGPLLAVGAGRLGGQVFLR